MTLTATKLASSPTVCTGFCYSVSSVVSRDASGHNSFDEAIVVARITICHLTEVDRNTLKAMVTSIRAVTVFSSFHLVIDETRRFSVHSRMYGFM